MFENAKLMRLRWTEMNGLEAGTGDTDHFTGSDITDVMRIHQVERTRLGRHNPRVRPIRRGELSEGQRAEATRVAYCVKLFRGEHEQRIRAFHLIECVAERARKVARLR